MMQLPGGLWEDGVRRRSYSFKPLDGALELSVAEASDVAASMPEAVTLALQYSLSELGGMAPAPERIAALCVADRQFLMRELGRRLGFRGGWLSAKCAACSEPFDFQLDLAELPVREAADDFPYVDITVADTQLRFRLPNGADQAGLLEFEREDDARRWLLKRCLERADPEQPVDDFIERLTEQELAAVEGALEETAPVVMVQLGAGCPACGHNNSVDLNPYSVLDRTPNSLLNEVHQIAFHYHWSEAEILGLPRERRRQYLRLIDRARGMEQ
jgi:hypothetical protein